MSLKGTNITPIISLLIFFSIVTAIYIILSAIVNPNFWVYGSTIYLLIAFLLYHYSNEDDKSNKDREILKLKQEVKKLESIRESDRHIIDLLEKELEKAQQKQN